MNKDLSSILVKPHITEKATRTAESSVFVFQVPQDTTKTVIVKAFVEKYKQNPVKVAIVRIPAKKVVVRGKRGVKAGYKKAYIYLKKGSKIEII